MTTPPTGNSETATSNWQITPRSVVFLAGLAAAVLPWSNPAIALTLGILIALSGFSAYEKQAKRLSRFLIQACVVMLGVRVNLSEVAKAAAEGVWLAIGTIVGTLVLGMTLARLLKIERDPALLVSSGTAICGGSAIAAVGASIAASSSAMAVATGAVFILNAVALYVFPPIGQALDLTPEQFGTWCGVAVHDMSSVAGAAKAFDGASPERSAVDIANIVKMTRVLWIAPIAIAAGWWWRRSAKAASNSTPSASKVAAVPWFIGLFLIASAIATYVPSVQEWGGTVKIISGVGFQAALFLIGSGLSAKALQEVGWRALLLAVIVWVAVATSSLFVIRATM
jgi:uncharacterized integral membrane protein (TIGR00698 family)